MKTEKKNKYMTLDDLIEIQECLYRHIKCGYYAIPKIDLPRAAKFKPRKGTKGEYVPKGVKIGTI